MFDQGMFAAPEGEDYEAQLEQAKRNRAFIEHLRSQDPDKVPRGQMVGKFYVPNSKMSIVAPAIQNIAGTVMSGRQDQLDSQRNTAMRGAAEKWLTSQPMATAQEQPGPPTEAGVGPDPRMVPPTPQSKMAWAAQGQRNPLSRALATQYAQDQLIQEPVRQEARKNRVEDREDSQRARSDEKLAQLEFRREQLAEQTRQFEVRANDARLTAADRAAAQEALLDLRRQGLDLQRQALDYRKQHDLDVINQKRESQNQKPLNLTDLLKLQTAAGKVEDSARFHSTFVDDFSGPFGALKRMHGTYTPGAGKDAKASSAWWNDYQAHKNTVRHELFGSALTATEKSEWEKSDINATMQPDQIRKNLERRVFLEKKAYAKLEGAAGAGSRQDQLDYMRPQTATQPGGTSGAVKTYNPATGKLE